MLSTKKSDQNIHYSLPCPGHMQCTLCLAADKISAIHGNLKKINANYNQYITRNAFETKLNLSS